MLSISPFSPFYITLFNYEWLTFIKPLVPVTPGPYPIVTRPPPECTKDSECPDDKSCLLQKCTSPCDVCGVNADCRVRGHRAMCSCPKGYEGNPTVQCVLGERNILQVMLMKAGPYFLSFHTCRMNCFQLDHTFSVCLYFSPLLSFYNSHSYFNTQSAYNSDNSSRMLQR